MSSRAYAVTLRHIFISPGHNFKGHHGRDPGEHPVKEVPSARCIAGKGLAGDRYCGYKEDYEGQVTFFSWEVYQQLCLAIKVPHAQPSALRRNIFIEGVDLNELVGCRFEIHGVLFEGSEECAPCYWMDRAVGPGAEDFLQGQGGLRARIIADGEVTTGRAELRLMD